MDDLYVDCGYMEQGEYSCVADFPCGKSGRDLYWHLLSNRSPFVFESITWQEDRAYGITKDKLKQFISEYYKFHPISLNDCSLMYGRDIQQDLPKLIEAVEKINENAECCIRTFIVPG